MSPYPRWYGLREEGEHIITRTQLGGAVRQGRTKGFLLAFPCGGVKNAER